MSGKSVDIKCVSGNTTAIDEAWRHREGRVTRYDGKRLGGTTVVHSIKKHMWFLEAATALLEGEDYTETEQSALIAGSSMQTHDSGVRPIHRSFTAARRKPLQ